jgi:cell wall-associated NlpC family hydrolase
MKQKNILIFTSLLFLFVFSSCVTRRYEVYTPNPATNATRRLSTQYGIQVTPRDNDILYYTIAQWLGTPYRRGLSSMKGTDCSGFVINVYRSVYGKNLARTSADMLRVNCRSIPRQNLREGNLVFFATTRNARKVSHVGIYLKDGKFAHASASQGVIISNLNEPYYRLRWISGGIVR